MLYIDNAQVHTPDQVIDDASILIDEGIIIAVGSQITAPSGATVIDASNLIAAPGFIDFQLNGGFGHDFTADPTTIWQVAVQLPQHGVTAFLPTIITSPFETVAAAQDVLRAGPPANFRGAKPLGLHLEGPFLNSAKRGAHNPQHLRQPDLAAITHWTHAEGVSLVTLAPELPNALGLIQCLHANGVLVSAGHSMANYEEALTGFDAGISYGTHLFNAMPTLDHRAPGLAAALLTDPRPTLGLIPDGVHLHPAIVKLIWQAKDSNHINVVTDAMAALGMPAGTYQLGDFEVTVDETSARLNDGRLAGSILSMDAALRNLIKFTGCTLSDALATITSTPARLLGLTDRGRLEPGCIADLVLLSPELKVVKTIVEGNFERPDLTGL
jgi:N-acetylglucosamine-6-phosphate deacetylase